MSLSQLGQIALPVSNADASEAFYSKVLGLPVLFRFGELVFLNCGGIRLMLGEVVQGYAMAHGSGAGIGRKHAGKHLQQRTLTGSVFADQRNPLAAFHGKIERLVDHLFSVAFTRADEIQHLTPTGGG